MPTATFLKLKPEKRQHITAHALQAFALQDFEAVSITRLMQALRLPKGSFYQYFEDKKDLYFYLFDYFQEKKENTIAEYPKRNVATFFDIWEDVLVGELQYYWQNPTEWSFWLNAYHERNSPEIGNLQALILQRIAQQMLSALHQEGRQGTIRQDISLDLQAYFLASTQASIAQFALHKYQINLAETITQNNNLPAFPAIEVRIMVAQWLQLLKSSINILV